VKGVHSAQEAVRRVGKIPPRISHPCLEQVHPGNAYFCWCVPVSYLIRAVSDQHRTNPPPWLWAGCIIGPFLYLFETLPQPLPELREGGYRVRVFVLSGRRSEMFCGNNETYW